VKEDPGAVLLNFWQRILIFANAREWSQEFDVYAYRNYSRFLILPWTGFWLIGPLGFVGLLLCRRPTQNQTLLIGVAITVILSTIPFKASDRYRLPSAVLLALFAALALWHFFMWLKVREKRPLFKWLALVAFFCLICWPDWPNLAARKTARHHYFIGKHYEYTGRLPEAIRAYQKSLAAYSWDADSPYRLSLVFDRLNQRRQAVKYLNLALQREPEFPQALNQLARHHMRQGALAEAEKRLTASLELAPAKEDSLILMAELQRRKGAVRREIDYLKDAVEKSRSHRSAMLLADRFTAWGNYAEAVELYDRVMRSRQADKLTRVAAGMLAGMTIARYLSPAADEKIYWRYILKEFDEFKFFSLQAKFLNGGLSETEFRKQMGDSPAWQVSAEYVIGLNLWLKGDAASAALAFERCLQDGAGINARRQYSPLKWAREDLRRLGRSIPLITE
jgi:tetratricopeptide (TPR) repeat protein